VQEAMACGLPAVISADEIYALALAEADVCAAAPRAPAALAARVREMLTAAGTALGGRARAYACAHWSLPTMVTRYVELMARLTRGAAAQGRRDD